MLVGVNKYAQNPLRFCVADAKLMADTLAKNCGYPRSHILLLTDDQPDPDLRPTKINLQKQITVLLKKVKEKDTVLVSFGGHGFAADGQSFFCPLDFDGDNPKLTGWRTDEVRSLLHDCRAAQKLLVLDCCHSGGSRVASPDPSGQEVGGGVRTRPRADHPGRMP